ASCTSNRPVDLAQFADGSGRGAVFPANCGTPERSAQVAPAFTDTSRPPEWPFSPAAAYTVFASVFDHMIAATCRKNVDAPTPRFCTVHAFPGGDVTDLKNPWVSAPAMTVPAATVAPGSAATAAVATSSTCSRPPPSRRSGAKLTLAHPPCGRAAGSLGELDLPGERRRRPRAGARHKQGELPGHGNVHLEPAGHPVLPVRPGGERHRLRPPRRRRRQACDRRRRRAPGGGERGQGRLRDSGLLNRDDRLAARLRPGDRVHAEHHRC